MADDEGDVQEARGLIEAARCVLFDFDGPICRLFPEGTSAPLADELRVLAAKFGVSDALGPVERDSIDPHVVLRAVHEAVHDGDGEVLAVMEEQLTAGERAAARTAWPTPYAVDLVHRLAGLGHRLAIVTNNSPHAARLYLSHAGLLGHFETIQGRTADPGLMKPDPDVVFRALRTLAAPAGDAVLIGDSGPDVHAARAAGTAFVGYGRNERKIRGLRQAGAGVVISSYRELLRGG
ncbi:HAD family hydrolase [Streptomyces sp. NPDC047085]|uniref:HAD family hydrolase n=1 Tax=Streptomyces sp. NPDC047085 TaxID=3155140 RepID=UPI0033E0BC14